MSPFCDLHGGAVLNVTINRYAHASLRLGGPNVIFRACDMDIEETYRVDENRTGEVLALHGAVCRRISREFLAGANPGLILSTMIDAPPGSGLGSSSALVVAMVEAFRVAFDLPLGRYEVARIAYEIERLDLGLAGGRQDQYAAAFGGVNFIEFLPENRVIVNPLRLPEAVLKEMQSSMVVCFTGHSRTSHSIINDQVDRISSENSMAMGGMHQLKHEAFEMKMALLRGDLRGLGDILSRSWTAKKNTSARVTNSTIEKIWEAAIKAGAWSGKVSGAGGGGFLMFMCDPEQRCHIARAVKAAGGEADTITFSAGGADAWPVAY